MTTATIEATTEFTAETFTWQAIKALAKKANVPFYSASTFRTDSGIGFSASRWNPDRIIIAGYLSTYGDNEYMKRTVGKLSYENFMLKMELFFLKNNIAYEYIPAVKNENSWGGSDAYFRIAA